MTTAQRILWILLLTVLWPVIHLAVFALRFGHLPAQTTGEAWVFLPMGFLSAIVLVTLINMAPIRASKVGAMVGYALAVPVAFIGSLFGGLVFEPWLAGIVYGALPLMAGTALGYLAGKLWDRVRPADPQSR
jgi:hypothetical protein